MAAADTFHLTVTGRGGHGAMPHLTADPVVAAAAVIVAVQPLVSRETSPTDGTVVTVATVNTGLQCSDCCSTASQGRACCAWSTCVARCCCVRKGPALRMRCFLIKTLCGAGAGAPNVIPDKVQLSGTIRALTNKRFGELRQRVVEVMPSTLTFP